MTDVAPYVQAFDRLRESGLTAGQARELACKAHLGVWTEVKRELEHAPHHWEWCELYMQARRLAVIAPREHAKTETFSINGTVWRSRYQPGTWTYVFSQTGNQAKEVLDRIEQATYETHPWMLEPYIGNKSELEFSNGSRVTVAGAGKSVRGAHPDVIIGDDVLSEGNTRTAYQRKKTEEWWFGTVGGMAHPGTTRTVGRGQHMRKVELPPTVVILVGTPFHQMDLLMGMRDNPLYQYRRYASEFDPEELIPGTMAVEAA